VSSPAQWSPDPTGRHEHRWWDGERWTDQVSDAGIATVDAMAPPPPPPVVGRSGLPGAVIALIVAAVIGLPILGIAAVTLLGNDASQKFEEVGERIQEPASSTSTTATTSTTISTGTSDDFVVDAFVNGLLGSAPDSITEADARCIARSIIDQVGQDKLIELGLSAQDGQPEFTPELQAAVLQAFDDCLTPEQKAELGAN
jgi:hypothetical protein